MDRTNRFFLQVPNQGERLRAGHGGQSMQISSNSEDHMAAAQQAPSQATPPSPPVKSMPTPREIRQGLNEYVIGQSKVKVALSVGVYNHYKRIFVSEAQAASEARRERVDENEDFFPLGGDGGLADLNLGQFGTKPAAGVEGTSSFFEAPDINSIADEGFGPDVEECEIDKSNIMLLGPTGSGKTHLVKTLARLIDVPLVIADATCLTQAGYVGEDVESILFKVSKLRFGIISAVRILTVPPSSISRVDKTLKGVNKVLFTLMKRIRFESRVGT